MMAFKIPKCPECDSLEVIMGDVAMRVLTTSNKLTEKIFVCCPNNHIWQENYQTDYGKRNNALML